jgi:hypothetical protein
MKTEEVADTDAAPKIAEVLKGNAVGISRAKQSPHARANNNRDRHFLFFEHSQNA